MKFVTYNIQFGLGKDGVNDIGRIAEEVEDADIIALQEVERFWKRSGNLDQVAELSNRFPHCHWAYGPGIDLNADIVDANGHVRQRRKQFGNMLLSKWPIRYTRHHQLPKYGSIGPISIQRSALECVIELPQTWLRIMTVHLTHLSSETRLPQVQALLDILRNADIEGPPINGEFTDNYWDDGDLELHSPEHSIIFGDFNCEPDSPEYELMVGPMSTYGGRITNPTGFVDAWVEAGHAEDTGVTSDIRGRQARLDYAFVSAGLRKKIASVYVDTDAQGSDHLPVWLEMDFDS